MYVEAKNIFSQINVHIHVENDVHNLIGNVNL